MPTEFDSDSMLAFMTELTKKVADLKKEMVGVGEQAGTGIHKTSDETERFGKTVERHTKHIEGMKNETAGLVGLLRGPLGIAAAFYGAGQAMANFTRGELQLRNFASDVGLTSAAIQKMRVQLSAAGIDSKTADQQISALTSKLDSIKTLTTASPVYKDIAANDPILAKQLLDAERLGNRVESIRLIVEKLQSGGPRSKLYLQEKLGVSASTAAALGKDTKGLVMPWVYDEKELEKYNREWTNLTTHMSNAWGFMMMGFTTEANKTIETTKKEFEALRDFAKKDVTGPKGFLPSAREVKDLFGGNKGSFNERFGTWGDEDEGALPKNARPRSFSPEGLAKDELEIQKNSNQLLQDIRDLIGGDKQGIWGGGSGAAGRGGAPGAGSPAATSGSTPGTPSRGSTGADGRVPETEPGAGGGDLSREQYEKKFKGTPLEGQYDKVVAAAGKHNVSASLVASIMAHETGAGTSRMLRERNNPAGLMDPKTGWKTGQTFGSIDEGIEASARVIAKNYERGGRTIAGMANIYAPPGAANDPRGLNRGWRAGVEAIDKSLSASRDLGGAKIQVDFNGAGKDGKTNTSVLDQGPFKKLRLGRAPQAPSTGGGFDDFNRFAFE